MDGKTRTDWPHEPRRASAAGDLLLDAQTRRWLWRRLGEVIESYLEQADGPRPQGTFDPAELRRLVATFDFDQPMAPVQAVEGAVAALLRYQPNLRHPRHFGLFEPASATMGIVAEALVAAFNPCLATWAGSPFGVEVERHLIRAFSERFGYPAGQADGVFTSGGSEANLIAVQLALVHRAPDYPTRGLRALPAQPAIYISTEAHPSFLKAAQMAGLGVQAVRRMPVDNRLRLDLHVLRRQLAEDRDRGQDPLLVVCTAGTTGAGAIDPLPEAAALAASHRLWLHVDAAWGGAAILVPELRPIFSGIEQADSITFDPHKWLSVPMGAGLSLNRHRGILGRAFGVGTPLLQEGEADLDPYASSPQWSRRFAGLKVLLTLAVAGWDGYADVLRHQIALGRRLRMLLERSGWTVMNNTPLPVVCFIDGASPDGGSEQYLRTVIAAANGSGRARIYGARIGGRLVIRACVTNYLTSDADVEELIGVLADARAQVACGRLPNGDQEASSSNAPSCS